MLARLTGRPRRDHEIRRPDVLDATEDREDRVRECCKHMNQLRPGEQRPECLQRVLRGDGGCDVGAKTLHLSQAAGAQERECHVGRALEKSMFGCLHRDSTKTTETELPRNKFMANDEVLVA